MAFKLKANSDGTASFLNGSDTEVVKFPDTSSSTNKIVATVGDLKEIGVSQTLQNMTASRALSTTYTNSTDKPIEVTVMVTQTAQGTSQLTIDGVSSCYSSMVAGGVIVLKAIIKNGSTYSVSNLTGGCTLSKWMELR